MAPRLIGWPQIGKHLNVNEHTARNWHSRSRAFRRIVKRNAQGWPVVSVKDLNRYKRLREDYAGPWSGRKGVA